MARSTGFPDFMAFKNGGQILGNVVHTMVFIECKVRGYLNPVERDKAQWYLKNGYCSKFLIAYKTKEGRRVKVNYKEVLMT